MKKLLCIFLCTVMMLSLYGCDQSTGRSALSQELQSKIKNDFAKYENESSSSTSITADDVIIDKYFGTYQDSAAIALMIRSSHTSFLQSVLKEEIAGFQFTYNMYYSICIYQDETFVYLGEAYEKGIISKDDVEKIHELYERSVKA